MDRRLKLLLVTFAAAGCTYAPRATLSVRPATPAAAGSTAAAPLRVASPARGRVPAVVVSDRAPAGLVGPVGPTEQRGGLAWGADSTPRAVLHLAPYMGRLRTVEVAVGDRTLPFLLDTGGGVSLVTPSVAGILGCKPFGRGVGFRHDGSPIAMQRCPPVALRVDGWSAAPREVGVYDLMALLPDGLPVLGGVVALNTFDDRVVTLDLGSDSLVVEGRGSRVLRLEGASELRMREAHQAAGASLDVFLAVAAEEGPLWFELDSGNAGPVLLAPHAAEELGLDLSTTEPRTVTLTLEGYGPVTVEALEKDMIYDGLFNAAFLETVTLTLDLLNERAWIAP